MSWAGSAFSAILSLKYNRSLTSNNKAIASFRDRSKMIRMTYRKTQNSKKHFVPKSYSVVDYEIMKRTVNKKVKSEQLISFGKAILVFVTLGSLVTLFFLKYPMDGYLFWAR